MIENFYKQENALNFLLFVWLLTIMTVKYALQEKHPIY